MQVLVSIFVLFANIFVFVRISQISSEYYLFTALMILRYSLTRHSEADAREFWKMSLSQAKFQAAAVAGAALIQVRLKSPRDP